MTPVIRFADKVIHSNFYFRDFYTPQPFTRVSSLLLLPLRLQCIITAAVITFLSRTSTPFESATSPEIQPFKFLDERNLFAKK